MQKKRITLCCERVILIFLRIMTVVLKYIFLSTIQTQILNEKFSGEIEDVSYEIMFPDQYFTCPVTCLSCEQRCTRSMGHLNDNLSHINDKKCKYVCF